MIDIFINEISAARKEISDRKKTKDEDSVDTGSRIALGDSQIGTITKLSTEDYIQDFIKRNPESFFLDPVESPIESKELKDLIEDIVNLKRKARKIEISKEYIQDKQQFKDQLDEYDNDIFIKQIQFNDKWKTITMGEGTFGKRKSYYRKFGRPEETKISTEEFRNYPGKKQ